MPDLRVKLKRLPQAKIHASLLHCVPACILVDITAAAHTQASYACISMGYVLVHYGVCGCGCLVGLGCSRKRLHETDLIPVSNLALSG